MPRFIERLTYLDTKPPITAAQARQIRLYDGANEQHRFVNRTARRQHFLRVQHRKRWPSWRGTRCA